MMSAAEYDYTESLDDTTETEEGVARRPAWLPWMLAAGVVLLIVGVWALLDSRPPGDSSVEAGFARDMAFHHDQAVEMALIIRDRTEDEELRTLATDIMLTQQAQIGQMRGWLDAWGLPFAGTDPMMAWMDHPITSGLMPGMATREEVDQLKELPIEQAEEQFLRLMIIHHQAGVEMANAALERTDHDAVVPLARAMATAQEFEIDYMQDLLEQKGFERVDLSQPIMDHHNH